jgi:TldD protein
LEERIKDALKGQNAGYIDIRLEEAESSRIAYRGRELEDIGRTSSLGGNVRALAGGGWGTVSFNDISQLKEKVAEAVEQAKLVTDEKVELAPVEPIVDRVKASIKKYPDSVPLADKKNLLEDYNNTIWSAGSSIQTSVVRYGDTHRTIYFASSEGAYIEQERVDLSMVALAVAREGANVQQGFLSVGSACDYGAIENLYDRVKAATDHAILLLTAEPVKGGEYTVVLDPEMAGVFVHEAFGHLSEADHVYENERLRELMVLGKRFGGDNLNILDGAAVPDLRGSYKYDDEGVPATDTYLIKEGILVGRLHSRETAAKMGETLTGNARAINYRFRPIVRMTNTYIGNGTAAVDDMMSDIKEGIYVKRATGGETAMEMFTFTANEAYMIRDGKVAEPVRDVTLTGNVFQTLANIEAIGNDMRMIQSGGGCGKGGQMPLPVSDGSPHIRIRNVVVGGK